MLANFESDSQSCASGRPCTFGHKEDGRYIMVIFDQIDEGTIYPVTAYDVPES